MIKNEVKMLVLAFNMHNATCFISIYFSVDPGQVKLKEKQHRSASNASYRKANSKEKSQIVSEI